MSEQKATRPKVLFRTDLDPGDAARERGAFRATLGQEGRRSWSDFLAPAVLVETERLELKYNEGEPFPSVEAGDIPLGRPMGE